MSQIYTAFRHKVPLVVGGLIGALVPVGTYTIGHGELTDPVSLQGAMVLGGLGFSAITVYRWGQQAFQSGFKAACFVLLIELMMSFSSTPWLGVVALTFLVAINAVANGSNLVQAHLAYVARQAQAQAQSRLVSVASSVATSAALPAPAAAPALPEPAPVPAIAAPVALPEASVAPVAEVQAPPAGPSKARPRVKRARAKRVPAQDLN